MTENADAKNGKYSLPEHFVIPPRLYKKWAESVKKPVLQADFIRDLQDKLNGFFANSSGHEFFTQKDALKVWDAFMRTLTDNVLVKEASVRLGPLGILSLMTNKPSTRPIVDAWKDSDNNRSRRSRRAHLAAKRIVKLRNPHSFAVDSKGNVLDKEDAIIYIHDVAEDEKNVKKTRRGKGAV